MTALTAALPAFDLPGAAWPRGGVRGPHASRGGTLGAAPRSACSGGLCRLQNSALGLTQRPPGRRMNTSSFGPVTRPAPPQAAPRAPEAGWATPQRCIPPASSALRVGGKHAPFRSLMVGSSSLFVAPGEGSLGSAARAALVSPVLRPLPASGSGAMQGGNVGRGAAERRAGRGIAQRGRVCVPTPARGPCPGEPPEGGGAGGGLKAPACELLCAGRTPTGPAAWTLCISADAAAHSSILAWRIPCTAEPGGLLSIGPHRVGHD